MKVQMELGWERTGKAKMKMKEEGTEKRNSRPVIVTGISRLHCDCSLLKEQRAVHRFVLLS